MAGEEVEQLFADGELVFAVLVSLAKTGFANLV